MPTPLDTLLAYVVRAERDHLPPSAIRPALLEAGFAQSDNMSAWTEEGPRDHKHGQLAPGQTD